MATRFKATDLKEMIRSIVKEEMLSVTKQAINEILSERYLKQLAEIAASRPRGTGRTLHVADGDDNDVEDTPVVLGNSTKGIYSRHPSKHDDDPEDDDQNFDRSAPRLTPEGKERNEMLSLFFEGTKPLPNSGPDTEAASFEELGIELPSEAAPPPMPKQTAGRRPITEVWKELAGVDKAKAPAPVASQADLEKREETRLKMLRESLERPVS